MFLLSCLGAQRVSAALGMEGGDLQMDEGLRVPEH